MKWLLLITLSLYSFIVQSAPCGLTNVGEQREHIYSSQIATVR